ncbi:MAG: DUF6625 family protein [Bacteroidota bacterium]
MKKVAIIVFFFGKPPWYFDFFYKSCQNNPNIDFLFFMDHKPSKTDYPNISFFDFSIARFNELASEKLNYKVNIPNGYKMCDLRPAFGVIFSEYLTEYDFWGYSDIDIIYGNLRAFHDEDTLAQYDYVSVKPSYPSGFYALFRNTEKMNTLFRKSKDFEMIFDTPHNLLFEECGGFYDEVINGMNILDTDCEYETLHHLLEKNKDTVNSQFEFFSIEGTPGTIKYDNGKLTYKNEYEVMMYHLADYKKNIFSKKKAWNTIPSTYHIDEYSFRTQGFFSKIQAYFSDVRPKWKFRLLFLDTLISRFHKKRVRLKAGTYEYMQETLEIIHDKNVSYIQFDNEPFAIRNLLVHLNYFYVQEIEQYFMLRPKSDASFDLLFWNGNLRVYNFKK